MSKQNKTTDPSSSKKQKNRISVTEAIAIKEKVPEPQAINRAKGKSLRPVTLHPLEELFGTTIKHSSGVSVNPKTLAAENGLIGLYFAAHWCPPCRMLTTQLAMLYDELKKNDKKFEVVYISFDYSEESFSQYFSKMPWYAIDYEDTDKREELAERFTIRGIPFLIIMEAETCQIVTLNGREIIILDPMGALFPWSIEALTVAMASGSVMQKEKPSSPEQQEEKQTTESRRSEPEEKVIEDTPDNVVDTNTPKLSLIQTPNKND